MKPLAVTAFTATTAVGHGNAALLATMIPRVALLASPHAPSTAALPEGTDHR